MIGVRRNDGEIEAAEASHQIGEFHRGVDDFKNGTAFDLLQGEHWVDGWTHAAELLQQRAGVLRHLPLLRRACMGAYTLLYNAPTPKRAPSHPEQEKRRAVLVDLNLSIAHLPELEKASAL